MRCREEEKVIPLVRAPFSQLEVNWVRPGLTLCESTMLLSQREKQELSISEGEL